MIDPATLTMDHVFEIMNAWAAKYARMHDQLAATLAEKDTLTAERDETRTNAGNWRAEANHVTQEVRRLQSLTDSLVEERDRLQARADLMQGQRDKALAEVREAERERDALATWLVLSERPLYADEDVARQMDVMERTREIGRRTLSAYLRTEAAPLVQALLAVKAILPAPATYDLTPPPPWMHIGRWEEVRQRVNAAFDAWNSQHPEPPEERGEAE